MNKFKFLLVILLAFESIAQADSIVVEEGSLKNRIELVNSIDSILCDSSMEVIFHDYGMTFSNSVFIQNYISGNVYRYPRGTYSILHGKKYFRKIYNRLKSEASIKYFGMDSDEDIFKSIYIIYKCADTSRAKNIKDKVLYNDLVDLAYTEEEDMPLYFDSALMLIRSIKYDLADINLFQNSEIVERVCDEHLSPTNSISNKLIVRWRPRIKPEIESESVVN